MKYTLQKFKIYAENHGYFIQGDAVGIYKNKNNQEMELKSIQNDIFEIYEEKTGKTTFIKMDNIE